MHDGETGPLKASLPILYERPSACRRASFLFFPRARSRDPPSPRITVSREVSDASLKQSSSSAQVGLLFPPIFHVRFSSMFRESRISGQTLEETPVPISWLVVALCVAFFLPCGLPFYDSSEILWWDSVNCSSVFYEWFPSFLW